VEDLEIRFKETETYLQNAPNKWQAAENFQALKYEHHRQCDTGPHFYLS
jgi:hypothetical protein